MKAIVLFSVILFAATSARAQRALDSAITFASVPSPGLPESVAVHHNKAYVSSPSTPTGTANLPTSRIYVYNGSGTLIDTYYITGENLTADHDLLGIAFDHNGNIYAASSQLGILKLDTSTSPPTQTSYSSGQLPTLPTCTVLTLTNCTLLPLGPQANGVAFDPNNNDLIVTDFFQGALWRVPWGGGSPTLWYQNPALSGLGPNGLAVDAAGAYLYFVHTLAPFGAIDKINLVGTPSVSVFHLFAVPSGGPDGMTIGASGNLYVAAPILDQIIILDGCTGNEIRRVGPYLTSPLLDMPTSIAFTGAGNALVTTSSAVLRVAADMNVLDIWFNDAGQTIYEP